MTGEKTINNYTFQTAGTIINETGATSHLGEIASDLGMSRVLLVSDPGLAGVGLIDKAVVGLHAGGIEVMGFTNVLTDPPVSTVLKALKLGRESEINGVIGFGGGSSMDVAKLVALLIGSEQTLDEVLATNAVLGKRLPLIQVPTTAGTGSEITSVAIVTTKENEKKAIVTTQLLPDIVLLDAELTISLPPRPTAMTGIDAIIHAIEAYTSKQRKNPLCDILAKQSLNLLFENIKLVVQDGHNLQARSKMQLGALLAGQAFSNASVGAVHALAYPIGGQFHLPHGLTTALLLPHVMRFNLPLANKDYANLARDLFDDLTLACDLEASAHLISVLEKLINDVGLEKSLTQVGVEKQNLPQLAKAAMQQTRLLVNNPREINYADALQIYHDSL